MRIEITRDDGSQLAIITASKEDIEVIETVRQRDMTEAERKVLRYAKGGVISAFPLADYELVTVGSRVKL